MICVLDYPNRKLMLGDGKHETGTVIHLTDAQLAQLFCDDNMAFLKTGHDTMYCSMTLKLLVTDCAHQP